MQKHILLLMFVMAAIMMAGFSSAQAPEAAEDGKPVPSSLNALLSGIKTKDARQCLPASCGSFGCCSGNCQAWCRQCGIPHACG
jgi:hypothetical protein